MASNILKFSEEIESRLSLAVQAILKPAKLKPIGQFIADTIRVRTRLGYGVSTTGANKQKLAPLSRNYVKFRTSSRQFLSRYTTPRRSNLTYTGQMLDSLKVTKTSFGLVRIGPKGYRSDGLTNEQVAAKVSNKRPFLNLSNLEIVKVNDFIRKKFSQEIENLFR